MPSTPFLGSGAPSTPAEGVKEAKKFQYIDGLMDILDDANMKRKFLNSPAGKERTASMASQFSPPKTPDTDRRPTSVGSSPSPTSRSGSRRGKKASPPPTPAEYLSRLESKLIPTLEALNPSDGTIDYTKYVGYTTRDQVREGVKEWVKTAHGPPPPLEVPFSRCVVCTLAFGTCQHTREWLAYKSPASRLASARQDKAQDGTSDLDDLLDVVGGYDGDSTINATLRKSMRTTALPLTHISNMHWTDVEVRAGDNIEGLIVDLSSPPAVGGGSGLCIPNPVGQPHLVAHGGVRYPRNGVFHAYSSTLLSAGSAVYESAVWVYSMVELTWHRPVHPGPPEDHPPGRYGHCAVALPDRVMWTFGGRVKGGTCLDDVHLWSFDSAAWKKVVIPRGYARIPSRRFAASAAFVQGEGRLGSVIMFGGRDGVDNFNDLWIYDIHKQEWSDPVCIGVPPSPRHGHVVVSLDDTRIMVLGGCDVSPRDESGIPRNIDALDNQLQAASQKLEECYALEKAEAAVAGLVLEGEAANLGWRDLARLGAQAAAAVAKRERDTALAAQELNAVLQERAGTMYWAKINSSHSRAFVTGVHDHRYVDVVLLDVSSKVWTEPNAPPCTGKLPLARMNHTAVNLAGKIIVVGGCHPTTSRVTVSDGDVHVLDVASWRWSVPTVEDTPAAMLPTLNAAATAVRRAKRVLEDAIGTACSMGVPGSRSLDVAESEAMLKVCEWRLATLQRQVGALKSAPRGRYGHAAVAMGQRIYFVGGWEEDRCVGSGTEIVVLDLEQADERERRTREEFHARLERERRIQEFLDEQSRKQREYEDRIRIAAEREREADETAKMEFEDLLSRLPPKTFAPTPTLKFANKHTIWVKWNRVLFDSQARPLHPSDVTYILKARGGFVNFDVGASVLVLAVPKEGSTEQNSLVSKKKSSKHAATSMSGGASITSKGGSSVATGMSVGYHLAKVLVVHPDGTFDVKYDIGGKELKVIRKRVKPPEQLPWREVYVGQELHYACESNVPDVILEREPGIVVDVDFTLQTLGTEFPLEEPSLHSPQITFSTNNRDLALDKFFESMRGSGGSSIGDDSSIATGNESKTKKKIKEAIEIDGHVIDVWNGGTLVEATAYGKHYV